MDKDDPIVSLVWRGLIRDITAKFFVCDNTLILSVREILLFKWKFYLYAFVAYFQYPVHNCI